MQTLKKRLFTSFLSSPDMLPATAVKAEKAVEQQQADGTWPDIDYSDQTRGGWKPNAHLQRLNLMAQALKSPSSALFEDATLKARTLLALRVWLDKDPTSLNWWHNEIGAPRQLGEIALLLEDDVAGEDKARIARVLERSLLARAKPSVLTGANLVWLARNQLVSGLLQGDAALVGASFAAIWNEVKISGPQSGKISEGIQADWSFHQHGSVLYSAGYGSVFTREEAQMAFLARETRFAAPLDRQKLLESHLLDGQQWMMRGGQWDLGAKGREIVRSGDLDARALADAAANLSPLPHSRRDELDALVERFQNSAGSRPLQGNRHFYASDFMTHHRAAFYASARMFSTRMDNTDSLTNDENKKSHHIADGANILMRRGDEYVGIFPVWDWQKIPGTTVEQNPAPLDPKKVRVKGQTSFVGGVSDGSYGVSAMLLQRDGLSARKAWFFFDDEYVCLGAGIGDAAPNPVVTGVNQCLLKGEVLTPRGTVAGAVDLSGVSWVRHDSVTYLFPEKTMLQATIGPQSGRWSDIGTGSSQPVTTNVFKLWIDHGARPADATYAYIVRPADAGPPAAGAASNIEIVSNTPELQAVRQTKLNLLGAVFSTAGQVVFEGATLSVDQPCLLLCRQTAEGLAVSVANPENQALQVRVVLRRGDAQSQTTFALPDGLQAGSSVTQILK